MTALIKPDLGFTLTKSPESTSAWLTPPPLLLQPFKKQLHYRRNEEERSEGNPVPIQLRRRVDPVRCLYIIIVIVLIGTFVKLKLSTCALLKTIIQYCIAYYFLKTCTLSNIKLPFAKFVFFTFFPHMLNHLTALRLG